MKPKNTQRTSPSAETFTLDGVGNVLTSTDPAGYTTEYVYDGANRVTKVSQQITLDPPTYEPTGYTYDPNGRLSRVAFDTGSTRDTVYDLLGEVTDTDGGPDGGKHFVYDSVLMTSS